MMLDKDQVKTAIHALKDDLLNCLDKMVLCNSFSMNTEGVDRVLGIFTQSLPAGFSEQRVESCRKANINTFSNQNDASDPILLTGHLDTVFPPGKFEQGLLEKTPYIYGPGVADMKGGLIVLLGALKVLDAVGVLNAIPVFIALNGDEEIGSADSVTALEELAKIGKVGLAFESAGPNGSLVTSRRGVRRYRLHITGEWGHSGFKYNEKQSAISEMAYQILRLEALNNSKKGINLNVGRVNGGVASSVVAPMAEVDFEVRFWQKKDGDGIEERILASLANPKLSGVKHEMTRIHYRPAMHKNEKTESLLKQFEHVGEHLGQSIIEEARTGASDANLLHASGLPIIDGLGPIGEFDHTLNERIIKESLFDRIELTAHLLWVLKDYKP